MMLKCVKIKNLGNKICEKKNKVVKWIETDNLSVKICQTKFE